MGYTFHKELFIHGKWLKFRYDASDASGIGFCGVMKQHDELLFAKSFRVAAPGVPNYRYGRPLDDHTTSLMNSPSREEPNASVRVPSTEPGKSSGITTVPVVEAPMSSPSPTPRSAWACTLVDGCTLRCNHTGTCQPIRDTGSRTGKNRPDFCVMQNGKRRVSTDSSVHGAKQSKN